MKTKQFKACLKCRALVPREADVCPYCGSNQFTDEWSGIVIVLDPSSSKIASMLGLSQKGRFVVKTE